MTVIAVVLAVTAAITFGVAAVSQHRAVRTTLESATEDATPVRRRLAVGQLGTLVADPRWRRGFVLMTLGTGCHVLALSLAPISLTQPINVLAVPTTIIATAVLAHRRPPRSVIAAAAAVVLGVGAFVFAVSDAPAGTAPTPDLLIIVAATVLTATVLLHLVARRLAGGRAAPHWLTPVLLSVAGAANFGTASSTFRLLAQDLMATHDLSGATLVGLVCFVPLALAAGAWSIQQAYAAGAASAVTATSALTDPVVALVIGMAVLAETPQLTPVRVVIMIIAATAAGAGVIRLARHDDAVDPGPAGDRPARSSSRPLAVPQTRNHHAHPARR